MQTLWYITHLCVNYFLYFFLACQHVWYNDDGSETFLAKQCTLNVYQLYSFWHISNKMQHYTVYLFLKNCSTCFAWYLHPSSGAHTTVFTVSGTWQTVTATCRYCGRVCTSPDQPWGPPSLLYNGYQVFPRGKERPGRDTDLLVPWSRKGRAIPLLPLWAVRPVQSLSACTGMHFTFFHGTGHVKTLCTLTHSVAKSTLCDLYRYIYTVLSSVYFLHHYFR